MIAGHSLRRKIMDQIVGLDWGIGTVSLCLDLVIASMRLSQCHPDSISVCISRAFG